VLRFPVTANVVASSPVLVTLMMDAMFLGNVGSYKGNMALHPIILHTLMWTYYISTCNTDSSANIMR
jgi:hypothetical protein